MRNSEHSGYDPIPEHEQRGRRGGGRRFRGDGPHGPWNHGHGHGQGGGEPRSEERLQRKAEKLRQHLHHGERNFWSEWHDERHPHGRPDEAAFGQALSPKEMAAWREFFTQTFGTAPENHWLFGGRRFSPWHQGVDSFNPFVATLLSKGGGLLPLYALHLISQKPRYGNEIMELLAERTHGQWAANPGAIYPLLTLLEKEGFVEGRWEDPAKRTVRIYTITDKGQAEVAQIKMIVLPKLTETVDVLQVFINDLQTSQTASATTATDEADAAATAPATAPDRA